MVNYNNGIHFLKDILYTDNEMLTMDSIHDEILEAFKQINPLATRGPDDIHEISYHKC